MMGLTLSDCSVTVALNLNLLGDCVCVFVCVSECFG